MSTGSKQVQPSFFNPPEVSGYRTALSGYLQQILQGVQGLPGGMQAPTNPLGNAVQQQYQGLLTGQDLGNGPYGAANRYLQGLIEGGENLDVNPLIQKARTSFTDITAPALREGIGAQFGIRYGTPVSESIARAGRGATEDLNAQLVQLANQGLQRRYGAASTAAGLQQNTLQGANQVSGQQLDRLINLLLGGGSAIGTGGQPQMYQPQYQNNSMLPGLLSLGGALAGGAFAGPGGAAAGGTAGDALGTWLGGNRYGN